MTTLTLDSPANRNALSTPLMTQLLDRLGEALVDPDVRAVVISHTGPAFCSGADLKEMAGARKDDEWAARFKDSTGTTVNYQAVGSGGGEVSESVSLSYADIEFEYKPQDDKGALGGGVKFGLDCKSTEVR